MRENKRANRSPRKADGHWSFLMDMTVQKKSRLVHSGPQTMSAKTEETKKSDSCGERSAGSQWLL